MRFILASSSPRRRELIASLGIPFEVIKPDVDESQYPAEPPIDYVRRLSVLKAQAVAHSLSHSSQTTILAADTVVILAADTIGVQDGEILGKPQDADAARAMLRQLRGRAHIVCTAFTLLTVRATADPVLVTRDVQTLVHMRDYSDDEIEAYIATGDPFDKAGSYAIQHEGFKPVAHIDGDYHNVVGLPLDAVREALQKLAILG